MNEEQINKRIEDFYRSTQLSDSKLAHILRNTPGKDVVVPFYRKGWFSYAAAACIAFMIVSVVVNSLTHRVNYRGQTELASQIINIYDNHYSPDVYSADLRSIETGLQHSGFSIIPSNMDSLGRYKILGGRNCGLNGIKAVHVLLFNELTQKECCLYILPDVEAFRRVKNEWVNVGDQSVSLWHDNGRLFALYEPSGK